MKKINTILEKKSTVSSMNLSNVKIDSNSSRDEISETLLKDINFAAKKAELTVTITTAVSGHKKITKSGNVSRHPSGNAVDISQINGSRINSENGDKLVDVLKKMGYETGSDESGKNKAVLWRVPDHYDHIHVSVKNDNVEPFSGDISGDSESAGSEIYKKIISGIFGLNESKKEKILEDIERIKKLL